MALIFAIFCATAAFGEAARARGAQKEHGSIVPAGSSCELGQGFHPSKSCADAAVGVVVQECQGLPGDEDACWDSLPLSVEAQDTTQVIKSLDDASDSARIVAKMEGSAWGVHTAASAQAMMDSKFSSLSLTYMTYAAGTSTKMRLTRRPRLKLTRGARGLLLTSPQQFVRTYGKHYVKGLVYGHRFLALCTFSSETSASLKEIEKTVELSFGRGGLFGAGGGSSAAAKLSSHNLTLKLEASFSGGEAVPGPTESLESLRAAKLQWWQTRNKNQKVLGMQVAPWIELDEVQEILKTQPADVKRLFYETYISPQTLEEVNEEIVKLGYVYRTAISLGELDCIAAKYREELEEVKIQVSSCRIRMAGVGETSFLDDVQAKIASGDPSWREASKLGEELRRISSDRSVQTQALYTPKPAEQVDMLSIQNPEEKDRLYSATLNYPDCKTSRLFSPEAWCVGQPVRDQWMQIDLGQVHRVEGLVMRHRRYGPRNQMRLTKFNAFHSMDGLHWELGGNFDIEPAEWDQHWPTLVGANFLFTKMVAARYVKIVLLEGSREGVCVQVALWADFALDKRLECGQ